MTTTTKVMNHQKNSMHNLLTNETYNGIVKHVEKIDSDEIGGTLLTAQIDGYGMVQVFEPNVSTLSGQISARRLNSGMPSEYMDKEAKDFKFDLYEANTDHQKKICNAYIQKFKDFSSTGLYIASHAAGTGKTLLSCVILNELLKRHDICVRFITAQDFISLKFKSSKIEYDWNKINTIKKSSLLVLDDLGANCTKESIDNCIFELVDYRTKNGLPTIYTSNIKVDELREKFSNRVASRILDTTIPLLLPEESIRDRQSKEKVNKKLKVILNKIDENDVCFD